MSFYVRPDREVLGRRTRVSLSCHEDTAYASVARAMPPNSHSIDDDFSMGRLPITSDSHTYISPF